MSPATDDDRPCECSDCRCRDVAAPDSDECYDCEKGICQLYAGQLEDEDSVDVG